MITHSRLAYSTVIVCLLASFLVLLPPIHANGDVLYAYVPSMRYAIMPPSPPFMMTIPLSPIVSAQQICASQTGWQWRADGLAMCFRPGNVPCPGDYPWMRRTTQHYTICLSAENPLTSNVAHGK